MQEKEEWKTVGMFRGMNFSSYEASTFGNVRSIDRIVKYKDGRVREYKGVVLSKHKNRYTGYMQVMLCYKGNPYSVTVHELVMSAHCPNPNPEIYTDINHIDEDKTNNRLNNLEWTTHKENCNHGTAIKRHAQTQRDRFIPIVQLDFDGNIVNVYYKTKDIDESNFNKSSIVLSINKKSYIYDKYFWIRLDSYNDLSFNELINLINEKLLKKKENNNRNKKVIQLSKNGEFIKEFLSIIDAAREIGCSYQAIQKCATGELKTCKGYGWRYK